MNGPDYIPVTIRFHRGTGWGSFLVRWWTASRIGHVDLVVGNSVLDVRPSVGVRWAAQEDVPDMRMVDSITVWATAAQIAKAEIAVSEWIGAKYDWWGAIAAGVAWLAREHAERGFCSEMVGEWLNSAGFITFSETWRLQPVTVRDLLRTFPHG